MEDYCLSYKPKQKKVKIIVIVVAHLRCVGDLFCNTRMDEKNLEKADKTHFMINVDNRQTLWFYGDKEVKYGDAVRD